MLTKIIKQQKSGEKPKDPLAKKWLEIEKKQKRNANVKRKIADLYKVFQDDILCEEHKLVELLGEETRHLMSFIPKKSLSNWQKEELHEWIESNLDTLTQHPFGNAELTNELRKAYSKALVENTKIMEQDEPVDPNVIADMRAFLEEVVPGKTNYSDEELSEFIRDPTSFEQVFKELLDKEEPEAADFDTEDDFDSEGDFDSEDDFENHYRQQYQEKEQKQDQKLKSLFNSSNLNKLYKILANRLHPDKEKNEHLKAEKSILMAKLVKAKKDKDAYTIISMFHQYAPESELNFFDGDDKALTEALIKLLNAKINELELENDDQKYHDGIKSMIWQKLSGRSKKVTQENIAAHLADLEDSHTRLNYYIHEVKTVKALKEILSERYEEKRFNPFSMGDFSLDDLDQMFR